MIDQLPPLNDNLEITEDLVKLLVNNFYGKIKEDSFLSKIFTQAIGDEWDLHLENMYNFWSSVILGTNRSKVGPLPANINLSDLTEEHFEQWLNLFEKTAYDICSIEVAKIFVAKAKGITRHLKQSISWYYENQNFKSA
jgi:hemoglobin